MNKDDELLLNTLRQIRHKASDQSLLLHSGFLDPRQQSLAQSLLRQPGAPASFYGGYAEAERRLLLFWGDGPPTETPEPDPLVVLRIEQRGLSLNHRDYLGSLLGLGIKRELSGDILVRENGADLIIQRAIADFLLTHLQQVGRYSVTPQLLPIVELIAPPPQLEEKRLVVASPRLDKVCAALFHLSRTEAAETIRGGTVLRNGLPCLKPDQQLSEGDTISLRGKGKARLKQFQPSGKKDRLALIYDLYV